ncbi:MAG: TIGR00266 family protein [Polyangiaceae bacterium]|nr:TIGR00266 family protein [Polyangiaceae bacterium]
MRHEILHAPGCGVLRVTFERPGEQVMARGGAAAARDAAIEEKAGLGQGGALGRTILGGEGLLQSTFTATAPMQSLWLAPPADGEIERAALAPGEELFLQSGAYLASTPDVLLDARWDGARGFFAGGLLMMRAYGRGEIWFAGCGALHAIDLEEGSGGYVCRSAHLVAFTAGLDYEVRKPPGEGLACALRGRGRLWLQTRDPAALAAFLHPFRGVGPRG